jgi:hypothetical protein
VANKITNKQRSENKRAYDKARPWLKYPPPCVPEPPFYPAERERKRRTPEEEDALRVQARMQKPSTELLAKQPSSWRCTPRRARAGSMCGSPASGTPTPSKYCVEYRVVDWTPARAYSWPE